MYRNLASSTTTGLRRITDESVSFHALQMAMLALNFIVLALYDASTHSDSQPHYLTAINLLVDSFFVLEVILYIVARNGNIRTGSFHKICSLIAALASLTDIALIITTRVVNLSDHGQYNYLEIVRAVRMIKIGVLTKSMPPLGGNKSLVNAAMELLVQFTVPLIMMSAFALAMYVWVGDHLHYRCVPDGSSISALTNNQYYNTYGISFFYSPYNNAFCGEQKCDEGFKCANVIDAYGGVLGDFDTPWKSFVTNMSFLTMRGWTNIFWAITYAKGRVSAAFIALILMGIGGMLILNTVVAVVVRFMKTGAKYFERRNWLRLYPGDISSVTELDLVMWAKRNNQLLLDIEDGSSSNIRSLRRLLEALSSSKWFNSSHTADTGTAGDMLDANESDENILSIVPDSVSKKNSGKAKPKIRILSPNCNIFKFIRHAAQDRFSPINLVVFALIFMDLILFACVSRNAKSDVWKAVEIGNEIICALFAFELVIMLISFGPIHYWNSFFNIYETVLILLALGSLPNGVCPYANIFRIIRIFRDQSRFVTERTYERNSIWTELNNWIMMINEAVESIGLYVVLSLTIMYAFAIIGTRTFPTYLSSSFIESSQSYSGFFNLTVGNGITYSIPIVPLESNTTMPLVYLESTWSNRVAGDYSYDNFSISYVTTFSLAYLNSWYSFMVQMMLRTHQASFWYFFVWIMLTNLVLMPVLTSRILSVMDKRVSLLTREVVDRNRMILERLAKLRQKTQLFKYFHKLKKNSADLGGGSGDNGVNAAAETAFDNRNEEQEYEPPRNFLLRWFESHKSYPLFIFAPKSAVKRILEDYLNTSFFSFCIFVSVLLNIVDVLGEDRFHYLVFVIIEGFALVFFCQEMFIKWISQGFYTQGQGYFLSWLNWTDFLLNALLGYIFFAQNRTFVPFLIIRVVKVPFTILWAIRSKSIQHLVVAASHATTSLLVLTVISLLVCFFFAVFGLQLWRKQMYYCATVPYTPYFEYPDGLSRFANTTSFPYGCAGFSSTYNVELEWIASIDTFDNIFVASQSIFRVMMMNNWGGILFMTMSAKGYNVNPDFGSSPAAFLFFIFNALFAVILNALFACVIYYHFLITANTRESSIVVNQDTVTFRELKDALRFVEPLPPAPRKNSYTYYKLMHKLQHSRWYLFVSVAITTIPIILVFGAFEQTYKHEYFSYYDSIYSMAYIGEYVVRILGLGPAQVIGSPLGFTELIVMCVIALQILVNVASFLSSSSALAAKYLTLIVIVLRTIRILWPFPELGREFRIVFSSLTAFVPLFIAIVCFVIVFAVVGKYWFKNYEYDYGIDDLGTAEAFLATNYNFKTHYAAFFTLWSIATGNNWTTVVDNLLENRSIEMKLAIIVYFVSFYLIMNFSLRSIAIIMIVRFLDQSGTHNSYSGQQVADFQFAWSVVTEGSSSVKFINRQQMANLLMRLNPPLGVPMEKDKTYSVIDRLIHKISLVIHAEYLSALHPNPPPLPMNKFLFQDVLIALHKIALFGPSSVSEEGVAELAETLHAKIATDENIESLPSSQAVSQWISTVETEASFMQRRAKATTIKNLARTFITQHVFSYLKDDVAYNNNKNSMIGKLMLIREQTLFAVERMQQLQYCDAALYRDAFVRLTTSSYHVVRQCIASYGLIDIDAMTIVYIRKSIRLEQKAVRLQCATLDLWAKSIVNDHSLSHRLRVLHEYYRSMVNLLQDFNRLYRDHVSQTWDFNSLRAVQHIETASNNKRSSHINAITAVCIDLNNTIYVSTAGGIITEWSCKHQGQILKENENFELVDRLDQGGEIRCMTTSPDAAYLYVGNTSVIVVYKKEVPKPGSLKKKRKFKEITRLNFHRAVVNCLSYLGNALPSLVSAANDGTLALWSQSSQIPLRKKEFADPIFAITAIPIDDRRQLSSERTLSDVLVCGLASGKLEALAFPLPGTLTRETDEWNSAITVVDGNHGAVTALAVAWGYLFAGCADGCVITFGFSFDASSNASNVLASYSDPLDGFKLVCLSSIACHSEAVTAMMSVGHGLISTSHDFGVVTWEPPERMGITSPGQYRQEPGKGLVLSDKRIICATGNNYAIVTGDEVGNVFVCSPARCEDNLATSSTNKDVRSKCYFSFLEHDFQDCFAPFRSVQVEEEVFLNVRNISAEIVTLRTGSTKSDVFSIVLDGIQSVDTGCILSGSRRDAVMVPPHAVATFRIRFFPLEADVAYQGAIEFLIDEIDIVRVIVKGTGIRSQLRLDDNALLDLGTIGTAAVAKRIKIFNPTRRDFVMNFCDNSEISKSFQKRCLQVHPKTLIVSKQDYARITVSFHPDKLSSLSAADEAALSTEITEQDLYFLVNGARVKVATVRSKLLLDSLLLRRNNNHAGRMKSMDFDVVPRPVSLRKTPSTVIEADLARKRLVTQPKRSLFPNESICTFPVAVQQLSSRDWGIKLFDNRTACLMHIPTGIFVELINPLVNMTQEATEAGQIKVSSPHFSEMTKTDPLGNLNPHTVKATSNVSIVVSSEASPEDIEVLGDSAYVSYYELWCREILISKQTVQESSAKGVKRRSFTVSISTSDLPSSFGVHMLELFYFNTQGHQIRNPMIQLESPKKPTGYFDGMLRVAYMAVAKGVKFELISAFGAQSEGKKRNWMAVEQLDIIGISKIVSFAANGAISCTENFDHSRHENDQTTRSSTAFGDATLSISAFKLAAASPAHSTQVCDLVEVVGIKHDSAPIRNAKNPRGYQPAQVLALETLKCKRGHYAKGKPSIMKEILLENGVSRFSKQRPLKIRKFLPEGIAAMEKSNRSTASKSVDAQTPSVVVPFCSLTLPVHDRSSNDEYARRIVATFHHDPLSEVVSELQCDDSAEVESALFNEISEHDSVVSSVVAEDARKRADQKFKIELKQEQLRSLHEFSVALDLHVASEVLEDGFIGKERAAEGKEKRRLVKFEGVPDKVEEEVLAPPMKRASPKNAVKSSGIMSQNYLNSLLPTSVSSPWHSLMISFTEPSVNTCRLHTLTTCFRAGLYNDLPHSVVRVPRSNKEPKFLDAWNFVLQDATLRLIQTMPTPEEEANRKNGNNIAYSADRKEEVLEFVFFKENLVTKLVRFNQVNPQQSQSYFAIYSHDTDLHDARRSDLENGRQMLAVSEEIDCAADQDFRQLQKLRGGSSTASSDRGSTAAAASSGNRFERVRVANIYGQTSWMTSPPRFMQELCEVGDNDHMLAAVKAAFLKLSELREFESLDYDKNVPVAKKSNNKDREESKSGKKKQAEDFESKIEGEGDHAVDGGEGDEAREEAMRQTNERVYHILLTLTNAFADLMNARIVERSSSAKTVGGSAGTGSGKSNEQQHNASDYTNNKLSKKTTVDAQSFIVASPQGNTALDGSTLPTMTDDAPQPVKEHPNSILRTRLNRIKLFQFLLYQKLPGLQKPLSVADATMILSTLQADNIGVISPSVFCSWISAPALQQQITTRVLTDRTIFARLLEENMDYILSWRSEMLRTDTNAAKPTDVPMAHPSVLMATAPSVTSSALSTMKSSRFVPLLFNAIVEGQVNGHKVSSSQLWRRSLALQRQLSALVSRQMQFQPPPPVAGSNTTRPISSSPNATKRSVSQQQARLQIRHIGDMAETDISAIDRVGVDSDDDDEHLPEHKPETNKAKKESIRPALQQLPVIPPITVNESELDPVAANNSWWTWLTPVIGLAPVVSDSSTDSDASSISTITDIGKGGNVNSKSKTKARNADGGIQWRPMRRAIGGDAKADDSDVDDVDDDEAKNEITSEDGSDSYRAPIDDEVSMSNFGDDSVSNSSMNSYRIPR